MCDRDGAPSLARSNGDWRSNSRVLHPAHRHLHVGDPLPTLHGFQRERTKKEAFTPLQPGQPYHRRPLSGSSVLIFRPSPRIQGYTQAGNPLHCLQRLVDLTPSQLSLCRYSFPPRQTFHILSSFIILPAFDFLHLLLSLTLTLPHLRQASIPRPMPYGSCSRPDMVSTSTWSPFL